MAESIDIVVSVVDRATDKLKTIAGANKALASAVGVAAIAITAIANETRKAIDTTVKYADEVRRLSSVTNQSAEETSRLIQVMDDYKLTTADATMAARKLSSEGLSLNIDTLGKLSDEYRSLNTGQEKSRFLMEKFGRSGVNFALIMDQGSAAINNQAASISKYLILNDKQIKAARELEIAEDNLADTKQALYVAVGSKAIPIWTDYLNSIVRVTEGENVLKVMTENLLWMFKDEAPKTAEQYYTEMADALRGAATATGELDEAQQDMSDMLNNLLGIVKLTGDEYMAAMNEWIASSYQAQLAADGVLDAEDMQKVLDYRLELGLLSEQQYDNAQKTIAHKEALDMLKSKEITVTTWYLSGYGLAGNYEGQSEQFPSRRASGGSIPKGGMAWVGDTPSGLGPHAELVYAPQGAYVFNANQSRSMGSWSPRAFTGGMIPPASGEMRLSSETIRQLASSLGNEIRRANG